jgi:hypothetical protein
METADKSKVTVKFDEIVKSLQKRWQSKRAKFKASRIPFDEAYISYAAIKTG